MLVDNPPQQLYPDINEFFHTDDLFLPSTDSRESSPQSTLPTPPQPPLPTAFPDILDPAPSSSSSSFFGFLDDDLKTSDHHTPFDFLGSFVGMDAGVPHYPLGLGLGQDIGINVGLDMPLSMPIDGLSPASPASAISNALSPDDIHMGAIDPQLVGTPSTTSRATQSNEDHHDSDESPGSQEKERERLTLTIAPIKVGGHGKSRRGTVQSGGVVKASAATAVKPAAKPARASTSTSGKGKDVASKKGGAKAKKTTIQPPADEEAEDDDSAEEDEEETIFDSQNQSHSFGSPSPSSTSASSYPNVSFQPSQGNSKDQSQVEIDWRPPPEVFQKMTSKEKRQLRNKISARNFRVRRKEYISTLECDIAERDRLLQAIRVQLGETQNENIALRQEIDALKTALLSGRGATGGETGTNDILLNLPPPAPLPAQSAAEALAAASSASAGSPSTSASSPSSTTSLLTPTSSTALLTPNTQKDLPTSPLGLVGKRAGFWGGSSTGNIGFGGVTPVHTTLVPEWRLGVALGMGGISDDESEDDQIAVMEREEQENINPRLNPALEAEREKAVRDLKAQMDKQTRLDDAPSSPPVQGGPMGQGQLGGFEGFVDLNPFSMKTLDAYRMHLWGTVAAQHHAHQLYSKHTPYTGYHTFNPHSNGISHHHQPTQTANANANAHQASPKPQLVGLANSLRPAYIFAPTTKHNVPSTYSSPSLSALLAGKLGHGSSHSTSNTSPSANAPSAAYNMPSPAQTQVQRDAVYAAIASQTLLRRLGSAFWEAFSGSSSSSPALHSTSSSSNKWDVDKVRKVLEGKAVVRVVDVEPVASSSSAGVGVSMSASASRERDGVKRCEEKCMAHMQELLEESMRSLTLGKKA